MHTEFGYEYFDDPVGLGYRGYTETGSGEGPFPWQVCLDFMARNSLTSALDVGCAKGYLVSELLRAGYDATGVDVSDYALSFTNGLPCVQWNIIEPMPFTADAVFALGVLCYVEEPTLSKVLRNLRQSTLRYLLFSTYYEGEPQDVPDPFRQVTRGERWWRNSIEEAGFVFVERTEAFDVYRTGD